MDLSNVLADHGIGGSGGGGLFTKMTASLTTPSSPALWDLWFYTSTALGKVSVQLTAPSSPSTGDLFICADPAQYGFTISASVGNKNISATQDRTVAPASKVRIYYEGTIDFYIVFAKTQQWDGTKWVFVKTQYWNGSTWITIAISSSNILWASKVGTTTLIRKIDPSGTITATSVESTPGTSVTAQGLVADATNVYAVKASAYNTLLKLDATTLALSTSANVLASGTSYISIMASSANYIYNGLHGNSTAIRQISKSTMAVLQSTASSFSVASLEADENEDLYFTTLSGGYATKKISHIDMSSIFYTTEDTLAVLGIAVGKTHIIEMRALTVKKRDKYTGALVWGPVALSPTGFASETPLVVDGNGDFYYTIGYVTYKNSGTTGLNIWSKTFKASIGINALAVTPDGFLMVSLNDGTLIKANATDGVPSLTFNYTTPLIVGGYDTCLDIGKVSTNPNNW